MSDLRWLTDMDPFAAETEDELEDFEQDVFHVIEQDPNTNLDDPRGLGIAGMLSKSLPGGLAKMAEAVIEADDRADSCAATLAVDGDGLATLELEIGVSDDVIQVSVPVGGST